jgi:hypothetical protein
VAVIFKETTATLQSAAAEVYLVPTGSTAQVDDGRVTNNSASDITVTLWRVPDGAAPADGNLILKTASCPAGVTTRLSLAGVNLNPGSSLYALASTGGVGAFALSTREQS